MDTQLLKNGLDFANRRKKWLILLALFGCSSYGAYKIYQSPYVTTKRRRISRLLRSLISILEMFSDSAETINIVSKDLNEFLRTDSDQIPTSLKQLTKIARSDELSSSLIRASEALTIGVINGYRSKERKVKEEESPKFCDQIMNTLVSPAGTGFVSAVVGSFARNMVLAILSNSQSREDPIENHNSSSQWINVLCNEKSRSLIADCIRTFVSTGVAVYLDKTMDINVYDELFSGLTNPKHQTQVTDFLVSISNGAVETLVKTSHQVLTAPKPDPGTSSSSKFRITDKAFNKDNVLDKSSGWMDSVSSTLAVPSNRRFVLDVTGRVTFETIRSTLDFVLWKLSDGLKKSASVVREEVIGKGFEVISYVGAKSLILIVLIFLALYLHVLGTRALPPAEMSN
jgi:hypothetical protein